VAACAGPAQTAVPLRHAEVNGTRLPYVEQGQGEPVLLVHPSVADHRTWNRQRAVLASRYRVIAYSQRYFGTEPWRPDWPKLGVPTQTDDLAAFIRGLGSGPVHLVGWSSGGVVALHLALKHPELVRSVFVYEPSLGTVVTDSADRKAMTDDRAAAFGPTVQAVRAGDHEGALRLLLDAVDDRSGALAGWPPAEQSVALANARTLPLEFFDSAPAPPVSCADLARLRPVAVVARGELTRLSYRLMADTVAACVGGDRHVVVPQARHLWPADDPRAFSSLVQRVLKQS
jgi:pimeloyl-ACP methyl ester carboxylesterase